MDAKGERMHILLMLSTIGLCLAAGQAWAASCPGERQDGKRVTVTGKIVRMEPATSGGYSFQIKECGDVVIFGNSKMACRVGGRITATGKFWFCSEDDFYETGCDFDEFDASTVSCR
jgi:hypothetical protein